MVDAAVSDRTRFAHKAAAMTVGMLLIEEHVVILLALVARKIRV